MGMRNPDFEIATSPGESDIARRIWLCGMSAPWTGVIAISDRPHISNMIEGVRPDKTDYIVL